MAGETIKDLVVLPLLVEFLRCFMLLFFLFVPVSHLGIPEFAPLGCSFASHLSTKCCQQLALLLLVNMKYYLKNKYLTTILCCQGYFWTF